MTDETGDEEFVEEGPHVGALLREAREAKEMTLEQVARATRVPLRSLQMIEDGDYDGLPAPTYATGFVKAYAREVGLNETEIGQQFREEIQFRTASEAARDYFEPTDPARVPPRSLAWTAALIAIVLALAYGAWRSGIFGMDADERASMAAGTDRPIAEQPPGLDGAAPGETGAPAAPAAGGEVILEAQDTAWLRVYELDTDEVLFEGELQPGETYAVPANADAPAIRTGRADALRVTVGGRQVPPLGEANMTIRDVRIDGASLVARDTPDAP